MQKQQKMIQPTSEPASGSVVVGTPEACSLRVAPLSRCVCARGDRPESAGGRSGVFCTKWPQEQKATVHRKHGQSSAQACNVNVDVKKMSVFVQ